MELPPNDLIAEFMGATRRKTYYFFDIEFTSNQPIKDRCVFNFEDLKYDSSWDWLMPVTEKIGDSRVKSKASYNPDLMFKIEIVNGYTRISGTGKCIFFNSCMEGSILNATYKAVIKFIEWYNKYNKS